MQLKRTLITLGAAALAVIIGTAASYAAAAYATGTVNVRQGPGTGYGVVDVLRRGEAVEIERCRGSWCFVRKSGPDGWVSANYLGRDRYDDNDYYDDDYYDEPSFVIRPQRPPFYRPRPRNYDPSFCIGNPNAQFCISGN
jgi:uncharacterized protein YraI